MKRKTTALLLVILLTVPLFQTASADNSGLIFTAVNDKLLDLGNMAAYVNNTVYVPANVFSTFGIYSSYFESNSTALLSNSSKQVFFDLANGDSSDSYGNTLSVSATFTNGQVYVPVAWACSYFGLYYSPIKGNEYGSIIRIKNGGEAMTDDQFLIAAASSMRLHYNEYYGTAAQETPAPTPSQNIENKTGGASISLCFIGLPDDKLLKSLDNYAADACFFVTADDVESSPDTIRKICGSGHSIGIYCVSSPVSECEKTADLIFEAAEIRPTLVTSPSAIEADTMEYGDSNGYAYFQPASVIPETIKYSSGITSELKDITGYTSLLITITENTDSIIPNVLQYFSNNHISVLPLCETFV